MATKTTEHTGGSSSYYTVEVKQPVTEGRKPYVAECLDIAEALELNIAEFNIFKAIWRTAAERQGKAKAGNNAKYDAEKIAFFAQRMLDKHNTGRPTPVIPSVVQRVYDEHVWEVNTQKHIELEGNDVSDETDQSWFDDNPLLPEHLQEGNLREILNYLPLGHYLHHPKGEKATVNFLQSAFANTPVKLAKALSKVGFVWNSTGVALVLRHHSNIMKTNLEEEEQSEHRRAKRIQAIREAFRKLT